MKRHHDGLADAADGVRCVASGEGARRSPDSGDLKVCGLPLVQTWVMRAPWTRAWTPAAHGLDFGKLGHRTRGYRKAGSVVVEVQGISAQG